MKCGIEIHQRLDTHKLFCNCPSIDMGDKKPSMIINRKQYAVKSELKEIDIAARFEQNKNKLFSYYYYPECNCEVEADESPPLELNIEALRIVLAIALKLNAKPVDEIQVMRKQVTDGSNTSGFQRTMLVASGGYLDTSKGRVNIITICLEEESAGIVKQEGNRSIFRLDRLGIPLIEIVTAPDIKNPEHARETAEKIGLMMRLTDKVMRGIGTIRQDINVSIEGGARVEIKGAQQLENIPKILNNEIKRQERLKEVLAKLNKRFNGKVEFDMFYADMTEIFESTESNLIKKGIKKGGRVFAMKLPKHAGILGYELLPDRRYGTELSDYAKVSGVKGIIHSDEDMDKYKINEEEIKLIKIALAMKDDDAFILVVGEKNTAIKALELVYYRAKMDYVPQETRKVIKEVYTAFMRPLSGKARMYPETDVPPIMIDKDILDSASKIKGPSLEEVQSFLISKLNKDLASKMLRSRNLRLFLDIIHRLKNIDPKIVAVTLEESLKSLSREGVKVNRLNNAFFSDLFSLYSKGSFVKPAIPEIIKYYLDEKGKLSIKDIIKKYKLNILSESEVKKIIKENDGNIKRIMSKYRLVIDPAMLNRLLEGNDKE